MNDVPSHIDQSPSSHDIYVGLSTHQRMWIIGIAAFIAVVAIGFALRFAFIAERDFSLDASDAVVFTSEISKVDRPELKFSLMERAFNTIILMKLVSNKQAIVLSAYSGSFALFAIGFALFLIGADGAFKVIGHSPAVGKVAITGTAPGLLCFIIAGWLLAKGIDHRSTMTPPELSSINYGAVHPVENCQRQHPITNACITEDEWQEEIKRNNGVKK